MLETESDVVDTVLAQWRHVRPDVECSPMGVVGRLSRLSRLLERDLRSHFAAVGLEPWEFDVLATIRRNDKPGGLTMGELLESMLVTSGAVTNRIDRLEAKGLVDRRPAPTDRRSVLVGLTELGRRLVDETLEGHVANEARLLGALTRAEQEQLTKLLRVLLLDRGDQAPVADQS